MTKNFQTKLNNFITLIFIYKQKGDDTMSLREQLLECKKQGWSIKFIAEQTSIKPATLYAFTSGNRNLSPEKQEKIFQFLSIYYKKGE